MSQKIITVRFLDRQGCEDLYRCPGANQVYARQPSNDKEKVFWYTTSKWHGGYEASSHVRAGIVFRVIDASDNILFEENVYLAGQGTYAEKKGEFYSDVLKKEAQRYKDLFHLISHDEWRTRLAGEKKNHSYSGMMDNWIYCEHTTMFRSYIDSVKILGREKHIIVEKCKHNCCSLEWFSFTIAESFKGTTEAICGYLFIDKE